MPSRPRPGRPCSRSAASRARTRSPWEYFFPALPAIEAHDYDTARNILEDALRELDHSALHYHLARVDALAGNEERARAELAKCSQRHQDAFAELELLPG